MNNFDLKDYIDKVEAGGFFDAGDERHCAVRIGDVDLIYDGGIDDNHFDLSFVGLHDRKTDQLYFSRNASYSKRWDVDIKGIDELKDTICEKVSQKLLDKMDAVPVGEASELDAAEAKRKYMLGEECKIDRSSDKLFRLDLDAANIIIKYLNDPERAVDALANAAYEVDFENIKKYRDHIVNTKKILEAYKENPDPDLKLRKELRDILENKKTVKIDYEGVDKDGKDTCMSFTIDAGSFRRGLLYNNTFYNALIINKDERRKSWDTYKSGMDIDGITGISYQKKKIFDRNDREQGLDLDSKLEIAGSGIERADKGKDKDIDR